MPYRGGKGSPILAQREPLPQLPPRVSQHPGAIGTTVRPYPLKAVTIIRDRADSGSCVAECRQFVVKAWATPWKAGSKPHSSEMFCERTS